MFNKVNYIIYCFLLFTMKLYSVEFSKTIFFLTTEPIDVVIPCAPKDLDTLEMCIAGIRENGKNIRRVIVVSKDPLSNSAEWFDEKNFPFNFQTIALEIFHGDAHKAQKFLKNPATRIGWVFQQLLKFYAPYVIPDISSNVLILDSDVIFLNPTQFMNEQGEPLFNVGKEKWKPYFVFGARLLPGWHRVYSEYSGICHWMLFQRPILDDFFSTINQQQGLEPWKAICRCIDNKDLVLACMSEYEMYFNYALLRTDQAKICPIKWINLDHWRDMEKYRNEKFHYMACQEWMRSMKKPRVEIHLGK